MKKLKMLLKDYEPLSFNHNGKNYTIKVVPPFHEPILLEWTLNVDRIIHIRKSENNGNTVTDFIIIQMPGQKGSNYFQLAKNEFLRFKRTGDNTHTVQVTFFTSKINEANGYVLYLKGTNTSEGQTSEYGIKAINNPKYNVAVKCRQLFEFRGDTFVSNLFSKESFQTYEFFQKTIANFIELNTNSQGNIAMSDKILPRKIMGCSNLILGESNANRKFFKGKYVCIICSNPNYIEETLGRYIGRLYAISIKSRNVGQMDTERVDSYVFEDNGNPDKIHEIRYQDSPQFMRFLDYKYHIRFEATPDSNSAHVSIFQKSNEVFNVEINYKNETEEKLDKLNEIPKDAKKLITDKIAELENTH